MFLLSYILIIRVKYFYLEILFIRSCFMHFYIQILFIRSYFIHFYVQILFIRNFIISTDIYVHLLLIIFYILNEILFIFKKNSHTILVT